MPLNQQELRQRALEFARERAEAQTFWNEFFHIFGLSRRRLAAYEELVRRLGNRAGSIDLASNARPKPSSMRAAFPTSTLADMYDPLTMPRPFRDAHKRLDAAVDACYRPALFANKLKRLESLFTLYQKYPAPLTHVVAVRKNRRRLR